MSLLIMFAGGGPDVGGGDVTVVRGKQARGRNRARLWWLVIGATLLQLVKG